MSDESATLRVGLLVATVFGFLPSRDSLGRY